MFKYYLILTLFLFLIVNSCVNVIDFERAQLFDSNPVIQGQLTLDDTSSVFIDLTRIFDKNGIISPPRIPNADVSLHSIEGQAKEIPIKGVGYFFAEILPDDPDITIEEGQSYFIRVILDGDTFESTPEMMLPNTEIKKLYVQPSTSTYLNKRLDRLVTVDNLTFSMDSDLTLEGTQQDAHIMIQFIETVRCKPECYREQIFKTRKEIIFRGKDYREGQVERLPLFETQLTNKFARGYYLTAIQYSISEKAYDYYASINGGLGTTGSGFEAQPGKVFTNIQCINNPDREAFGYFFATQGSLTRLFVPTTFYDENEIKLDLTDIFGCKRCISEKPAYWVE